MTPRAPSMPPDERKTAIVDAVLPLLREHGKNTTTKQIAEAAGIAEGTIFRVFASKDEIFTEAMTRVFDPHLFISDLESVPLGLPLRDRLLRLTLMFQNRFIDIFTLMTAMALPKPPHHNHGGDSDDEWRRRTVGLVVALLEPDKDAFRMPLEDVVRTLRLLTFAGSHPHISEQRLMTPDEIVDVVLHGTLKKDS